MPFNPEFHEFMLNVVVPGDGPAACDYMLLGDRPGFGEVNAKPPRPFVGPTGKELSMYLGRNGMDRRAFYISNCYPSLLLDKLGELRLPNDAELESHWPTLEAEIRRVDPKLIVTFGACATRWLMGKAGLGYRDSDCHHGMHCGYYDGRLLFSTMHPASGLHQTDNMRHIMEDFRKLGDVVKVLARGGEVALPTNRLKGSEVRERIRAVDRLFEVLVEDGHNEFCGMDTEGTAADPIMVQFCLEPGKGYAIYTEDREVLMAFHEWLMVWVKQ